MANTISFEEALKQKEAADNREHLETAEYLPDLELAWQTAVLNITRECYYSDGFKAMANRFFEFDAGTHQPIFKTIAINYEVLREYLLGLLQDPDTGVAAFNVIEKLTYPEKHPSICLNFRNPDNAMISTSWGLVSIPPTEENDNPGSILTTVVMSTEWNLWSDAPRDIITIFMLHLAIAAMVNAHPGPISFVCNRMILGKKDTSMTAQALSSYRKLVSTHGGFTTRLNNYNIIHAKDWPMEQGESQPAYNARMAQNRVARESAEEELNRLEKEVPLDAELMDIYLGKYLITVPEVTDADDLLTVISGMKLPEVKCVPDSPCVDYTS